MKSERRQCKAKSKRSGERCVKWAMPGLEVCNTHGGMSPRALNVVNNTRTENKIREELSRMERLTGLISADDPEARGDVALVTEIRRTVNRIRILDEWLQELGEQALGWGKVSAEKSEGSDMKGPTASRTVTFEAKINIYYVIQMEERKHLAQLAKVWIGAGFKQRELDLQERQVIAFNSAILELCKAFGKDPSDPEVRPIIHRVMLGIAATPPAEIEKRLV